MFKVTIREATLMTTVVAVVLMWWLERSRNVKYEARLTSLETRMRAFPIIPALQVPGGRAVPVNFKVLPIPPTTPTPAPSSAGGSVPVSFKVLPIQPTTMIPVPPSGGPVPIIPGDPPATR